jgi:hypothetical protein
MLVLSTALLAINLGPRAAPTTELSRRGALTQAAAALVAVPLAAKADVRGVNEFAPKGERDINNFLKTQGLPPLTVGKDLSALVGYIGTANPANIDGSKTKGRAFGGTLLVRFVYPSGWLPQTPSITENGEAGNLGANNYIKGDSANFAAIPLPKGGSIADVSKDLIKELLIAQMSNDVYEDVKVKKLKQVTQADGTETAVVDFTYTLLTRAGFTVNRKGVAGCMVAADCVVGIVTATTEERYKNLEPLLRASADSFRAYPVKATAFPGSIV